MEHPQMNPTPTPNSTAPVDIARLRELLAKATPGPWKAWRRHLNGERDSARLAAPTHRQLGFINSSDDDADFIAALRNDAPALLDEVEAARKERDEAIRERDACHWLYDKIINRCGHDPKNGHPGVVHAVESVVNERDKLREEVVELKGDLLNAESAITHSQKEVIELGAQAAAMRAALKEALPILAKLGPTLYPNHHCGPDSGCDGHCMDVAHFGNWLAKIEKTIVPTAGTKLLSERDSLRQQNERLLAEIEKLKSISRSRNWKESQ